MTIAEELCNRVAFIMDGRIRLIDTPRALKLQYGEASVRVEYLAAKVITLTGLALMYNLAVVAMVLGAAFGELLTDGRALPLLAGVAAAAALLVMAGFVAVARYDAINEYLLPSLPYAAGLMLPLAYVGGWESPPLYLHPLQGPLLLMRSAFEPLAAWHVVYGALASALWLGVGWWLCHRSFQRFVIGRAGGN
jgi:fluoroquinolone transport system permease protein